MSVEIAWKQNILVTDSYLLKLLLVVLGFGLQAFVCDFSRQNICSVQGADFSSKIDSRKICKKRFYCHVVKFASINLWIYRALSPLSPLG